MSKKIIEIKSCPDCPFYSYYMNVPRCKRMHALIPYEVKSSVRVPVDIPDFCPLEDADQYVESNFDIDKEPS